MAAKSPDPEVVQQARELVAAGCSLREAAKVLGTTAPTIKRWIERPAELDAVASEPPPARASSAPPAAALPAHMFTPDAPPLVALNADDPIGLVKQLIRELHAQIHADRVAGARGVTVSSSIATLEKLTKTLKQLEEGERKTADGITVSAAELARVKASLAERVTAICNRPLMCARCSRELSVFYGTGLTEAELNAEPAA